MGSTINYVSRDAAAYLTEFSTQFDAALALGEVEPWARTYGLTNSSKAIKTTYPLPVSAAGYVERKGDDKLRALFEKSLSMSPKEWVDGVAELARIIEAPDFIGWASEPARIAKEAQRQPNVLVAALLAANPTLEFDGKALFAADHPINVFDPAGASFDNDHTYAAGIDATFVSETKARFRKKKGPNGQPMGLRFTHLLLPSAMEEEAKDFFESDILVQAVRNLAATENVAAANVQNRHKGTITLVICDELSSDTIGYALDGSSGALPWIVQDGGSPEEIRYDKDSELYKNTGKVGVKYVLTMAAAAALPHAIERITFA